MTVKITERFDLPVTHKHWVVVKEPGMSSATACDKCVFRFSSRGCVMSSKNPSRGNPKLNDPVSCGTTGYIMPKSAEAMALYIAAKLSA